MTSAIETHELTKAYGEVRALDGIDLQVAEGSIFGFLGPNGAGKTTTLRILTGLARPTSGEARVLGQLVGPGATSGDVGFLPDVPGFYPWMTAEELLRFVGGLFGLRGQALTARVLPLLELAGLAGVKTRIGGFSRGMRQRLGVAQALVSAPRVLMLDEPTSALDPLGRKAVLDMVRALAGRATVFFSTHILSDAERVCDTAAILDRGRIVAQAPITELKARHGSHRLLLEVDGEPEAFAEVLRGREWAASALVEGEGRISLTVNDLPEAERQIPQLIADAGRRLGRLEPVEMTLEDVFVDLVAGGAS